MAERNPDEFHFGMSRAKAHDKGQKVADRGNPVLSHDAVKLLKTQDAGYLKTMAQATRKKRERLEEEIWVQEGVKGLEGQDGRRHIVFVESREEQKNVIETLKGSKADDNDDHDDVDDGTLSIPPRSRARKALEIMCGLRRPGRADENHITGSENDQSQPGQRRSDKTGNKKGDLSAQKNERRLQKLRKRAQEGRLSRLKLLKIREKELLAAERELELQRARMSNSIGGVNKAGFKWKIRERKK